MQRLTWKRLVLLTLMVCACARASHAQSCEPHWSDQFRTADLDVLVNALASFDDGQGDGPTVYAGGSFTTGGDVVLNYIGKLEDNVWAPLGTGTSGNVHALLDFDNGSDKGQFLIAGGSFATAGGIQANNIARWDGQSWAALGGGLSGWVFALGSFDDGQGDGPALFAGGLFTAAEKVPVNYVAKWDGQRWSPLGDGVNSLVLSMTVFDDGSGPALYVAGTFTEADGMAANFIARWDGEQWSTVGQGMDSTVRSLVVFDDGGGPALYAGGNFTTAGGVAANRIAKWDGVSWSSVGTGVDGSIRALSVFDDRSGDGPALYSGGSFLEAGGVEASHIAKWDGRNWSALGTGLSSFPNSFASIDPSDEGEPALYVGGFFQEAGDNHSPYFAKWNGTDWITTGKGMAGGESFTTVADLQPFDDGLGDGVALYAGGTFASAGGVGSRWIAKWDGAHWLPVGTQSDDGDGAIYALAAFQDSEADGPDLYAGGWFSIIGGITAKSVAKWDGAKWSPLGYVANLPWGQGSGVNGSVYSLAVFDDGAGAQLYVGGFFSHAGEQTAHNIARWDGSEWSVLGDGVTGGNGPIRVWAMVVFDDGSGAGEQLYVAGNFTAAGQEPVLHIARWDGTQWSGVGKGLDMGENDRVYALAVYDDGSGAALYAGGTFQTAGPMEVNGLAKWDGSKWSDVGGGTDGGVVSLTVFDKSGDGSESLYVAGFFSMAGGIKANSIARWNGSAWSPLGEGMGPDAAPVWTMRVFDDGSGTGPALFVGGEFTTAGGQSSSHIAKWIVCHSAIPGDLDGDGIVGASDLLILLANWGPCGDCNDCPADLDDNCTVGASDLLILLANWG